MKILDGPRIGVYITGDTLHALLVRRQRIERWWSVDVGDHPSLETALVATVSGVAGKWPIRPRVFVAVGLSASRVRRLARLPRVEDARTLTALVRGNIDRFFAHPGASMVCSAVARGANGDIWAAAFDESVVRAAARACRAARLQLALVVPAPIALREAWHGDTASWSESDLAVRARFESRGMPAEISYHNVRRESDGLPASPASLVAPLARLGETAARYALAFGAVQTPRNERLALRPRDFDVAVAEPPGGRRVVTAAAALVTGVACIAAGPMLVNGIAESQARERIQALGPALDSARVLDAELTSNVADASAFAHFIAGRRSITHFLGELTEMLPEGAWISNLSIDPEGGKVIVIGPSTSEILTALAGAPSISGLVIEGPVSPERDGDERLERSSLRFRWASTRVAAHRDTAPAAPSGPGRHDD